jgi:hypothetical protein
MFAVLDSLGSVLFIVTALLLGPILLLALWTHAIVLEMWHRLNKPPKQNGRERTQQPRSSTRFQPH